MNLNPLQASTAPSPLALNKGKAVRFSTFCAALLILVSSLLALRYSGLAQDSQLEANYQWLDFYAFKNQENLYRIQKEQLELRLNELAVLNDNDNHILEIYKIRIAAYSKEMDAAGNARNRTENEARRWETNSRRAGLHSRHLLVAALMFALVIVLALWTSAAGRKLFWAATLLSTAVALWEFMNAFLLRWTW